MELHSLGERLQDADLVARWLWEHWRDPRFTFEQTRAQLLGEPDCPATIVAVEAGAAVGVLGFLRYDHPRIGPHLLFVNSLYVVSAARRRGVGSALVQAAIERATAIERALYVYTGIAAWYEARGFTCVERDADSGNAVLLRPLCGG
jgi:ribosomal protein S18 acetylase RimI-like enzyme